MKARHLEILQEKGFPVPKFILVSENEEADLSFSERDCFAVRSNFSTEDGGEHSFAGQFLTRLNVKREKVQEAVQEVFASYAGSLDYKEKANRGRTEYYLKEQGKEEKQKNAERQENREKQESTEQKKAEVLVETVLIQEMLFPEKSGVLFTKNPKGILSEMVVILGEGLGDKVVEDQENVLTYHYFPGECLYQEGLDTGLALKEEELKTLFTLGERIEQLFQKPMDIEFAIEKGKVYILQAREITTLDMHLPVRILDNSNISESFPGICLPLSESFAVEMYSGIFTSLGRRFLGKRVSSYEELFQRMVGGFSGRMYYEISSWYDILRLLPFSRKIIPVWQGMLGVSNEEISFSKKKPSFFLKCRIALLFCYYFFVSQRKMKELDRFFQERYASYSKRVDEEEDAQALYRIFLEMKEDLLREWDITLINDMVSFISTHLYGKKTAFSLETMKPVRALSALKTVAGKYGLDSEEYRREKKSYISAYGDRIVGELKLETRTYRTNEELLDRWILDSLETETAERYELSEAKHSLGKACVEKNCVETNFSEKDCEETSCSEKSSEQKQRKSFLYRLAESSCNNREISRLHRTRCFGLMRRIVDKIGEKTIGFDVYYLSLNELKELLFSGKDFSLKIAREKELRKAYERLPVLSRVKLLGKVDRDPLAGEIRVLSYESFKEKGNIEERIGMPGKDEGNRKAGKIRQKEKIGKKDKEAGNSTPRVFFGRGVSKGIFRGEVLKIKSLQEIRVAEAKGKILLSYSTDPGWFPYLNMAEGLITERGSLLSHSAILARELEKPAVVNIPNIMEELQSGDIVEIDGDLGICSVIKQKGK
ncbi:PEP/pyruvate-binding domain-containing protein [Oribacterium sp. oral taxon 108]|uniref:PEP/pyruvate-binding domain-containing protein n=1 Tax=Oribacterium sp. oral taxon 108 TaxID=712414 RepID=UPI00020DD866|nr:PEP/pyruvate-binding domain-containing protein [Oribacterium sp. oral taxon 108]EGL37947.1 pyruvate phosphate dikinase, PEP/pyruvate binding domain protein [Oribacterium sp. oral taxon 108 str. F0425]